MNIRNGRLRVLIKKNLVVYSIFKPKQKFFYHIIEV